MDLTQIVSQIGPYVLAHAQWVGPALVTAGLLVRFVGKFVSRVLFGAGFLATAAIAYAQWQIAHNTLWAAGILLGGLLILGLLAWTIRGISLLFAFVLLAAGFYLLLYGWTGPAFAASATGSLTWAGATILTMIVTGVRSLVARHAPTAVLGAV